MVEVEAFGVDSERYALNKCLKRIQKKFDVKKVLEMPASGMKLMPSLYSLGFGEAGCEITLVNCHEKSKKVWKDFGFNVNFVNVKDLSKTDFKDNSFDFVLNMITLPLSNDIDGNFKELCRVSSKYVSYFGVNGLNVGFPIHNLVHRINKVEWNHGDRRWFFPFLVKNYFRKNNLRIVKNNVVDCPPWPDTLGFRDMRLHRMNIKNDDIEWHSRTIDYMKEGKYPDWIKYVYAFERFPMPLFIKYLYSHLFYVIGEKK